MDNKPDPAADPKVNHRPMLAPEPENPKARFIGAKGILEFNLETSAIEFRNACNAENWRNVVETIEYRLANLEYTPAYKRERELISILLLELREACYANGITTELMEEDRKQKHEDEISRQKARPRQ